MSICDTEQQIFRKTYYITNFPKVISFWISDLVDCKTIDDMLVPWKLQGHNKHRQDSVQDKLTLKSDTKLLCDTS